MVHPMLHAAFGIIDDHEIATILGPDQQVSVSEIVPLAQQWAIEHNGRFRPGYYILRILEAMLAGGSAPLWYANRLALALLSASALYLGLRVVLRPFYAGIVTLLFFAGPQNEVWTRLGPQEAYGVPLVLTGLAIIARQVGHNRWQPVQLLPGFALLLLAGFIKESFVPILPATAGFIYVVVPLVFPASRVGRLRRIDLPILLLLAAGTAAQLALLLRMLAAYGNQTSAALSLSSFFTTANTALVIYAITTLWFLPVAAGLATLLFPGDVQELEAGVRRGTFVKAIVLLAALGTLFLVPQVVIYGGNALWGRYLIPGNLFVIFAAAVGFYLLSNSAVERRHAEARGVVAGMLIAVALFRAVGTYRDAQGAAAATHKFQAQLAEIVRLKTQHPELPLLFHSTNVFDREPLVSVASYLAVTLPAPERPFLHTFEWEKNADSLRKVRLAQLMRALSLEGDHYFARIADFQSRHGQCIAVVFSGSAENVQCQYAVHILAS